MTEVVLICKSVTFYAQKDEIAFFEWLEKIKCIDHIFEISDELHLHIKDKYIADDDLRDLIAIFYRYKIGMKQLQIFLNEKNKEWFYDYKKAFWHKQIFG